MLTGIDHLVVAAPAIEAAIDQTQILFGRGPSWRAAGEGGVAIAVFQVGGVALELMAPDGEGPVAHRLRAVLQSQGEGLVSLAFATADVQAAFTTMQRRALDPEPIGEGESFDAISGGARSWRRTRIGAGASFGARLFVIERNEPFPPAPLEGGAATDSCVTGLDHAVIQSPDINRAVALYGGRLGLDLRLDRTAEQWGARFAFFRCGDAILEVVQDNAQNHPSATDRLRGLTWRIPNAAAAQARLSRAGLDVSEVRAGRKPGTKVFTVRSGACSVPTLMLEANAQEAL